MTEPRHRNRRLGRAANVVPVAVSLVERGRLPSLWGLFDIYGGLALLAWRELARIQHSVSEAPRGSPP